MEIDHDSSTPLYVQLAELLRAQIEDGTITRRLPSVKTLSQEHGVSHITAERALTTLKDEGLICPSDRQGLLRNRDVSPARHALPAMDISVPGPLPWLHGSGLVRKLTSEAYTFNYDDCVDARAAV